MPANEPLQALPQNPKQDGYLSLFIMIGIGLIGFLVGQASPTWPFGVATAAYLFLVFGLVFRRRRQIHVTFMSAGMGMDLLLLIFLTIDRQAVRKVMEESYSILPTIHIASSSAAVLLYFPTFALGLHLLRKERVKKWTWPLHRAFGMLAFFLRTLGFIFMFSLPTGSH